jgi:methionyl aminopeptidase
MIVVKSPEEIEIMRGNGQLLARTLRAVCDAVKPGTTTAALDALAEDLIRQDGAEPAFKGYRGFPATLCTSVNEEVVHGIPSPRRILRDGDVLSIDIGLVRDGLHADMATTVAVGAISEAAERLLAVTRNSLCKGIEQVTIGNRLSDISHAIGAYVEAAGFHVVREYVGHGIGRELHEDPQIPNYGSPGHGPRLRAGMVFAIEPMVKVSPGPTRVLENGWTVRADGLAAHFEHTVAVTESGADILTEGGDSEHSGKDN